MASHSVPKNRFNSAAVSPASFSRPIDLFEEISPKAWARGSALAIELLEETDLDKVCMCDEGRDGGAQDNILYRYLQRLRREAADQPQIEQAFCSVLSDMLASAVDGGIWDIEDIAAQARESGPARQAVRP